MRAKFLVTALCAGAVFAGCTTTGGGSDTQSTIYDTHRMVSKLDKDLGSTVTKLNETTAELYALVNASDTEQKRMRSIIEENQARVEQIQREQREMRDAIYRSLNITLPSNSIGLSGSQGVVIEPPMGVAEPIVNDYSGLSTVPEPETVSVPPTPAGDPDQQYQLAQRAYANNDYKTALDLFDEYLQLYPNSEYAANAQFWKAKCNLDLQDYQASIREFELLRSRFPSSTKVPFAMHNQAVAHERIGQIPQAKALLEDVIENYPVSPAADQARAGLEKLNSQ